jgi:phage-related protein
MAETPLLFVGGSRDDLRRFPADARRRAGFELDQVQNGELPSNWKPMTEVGAGVIEIRIHTETEHRVFYVAKFQEAIYVLHAFEKKSQKTPKRDVDVGRTRYAAMIELRNPERARRKP